MRIIGGLALLFTSIAIVCCSSSDSDPSNPTYDGGPTPDADSTNDGGGNDGNVTTTGSADFVNGSRLHAKVYEGGGAQLLARMHDTKLDIDCSFELAEDGKLRCLPIYDDTIDPTKFAGEPCNGQRVYVPAAGCAPPKIAALGYRKACAVGPAFHRIGALTDAAMIWEAPAGTTQCNSQSATSLSVYLVGDKVDASEFVEGTFEETAIADGLGVRRVKGADGSSMFWSAWDVARKVPCAYGGPGSGKTKDRCMPKRLAFEEGVFSDIACMQPAAYGPLTANECSAPPSVVLRQVEPDSCGEYETKLSELGAKITTTPFYTMSPDCKEQTATSSDQALFWAIGADIAITSLPAFTDKDEGSGRLVLRATATTSGARIAGRTLFDTEKKVECLASTASDGEMRCLPATNFRSTVTYFSDTDCKKPLLETPAGCTVPSYANLPQLPAAGSCKPVGLRYFTVGAKVTPAKIYANPSGSSCDEQTISGTSDYYDASVEIAPTDFAPVTLKAL